MSTKDVVWRKALDLDELQVLPAAETAVAWRGQQSSREDAGVHVPAPALRAARREPVKGLLHK